MKKIALVLVIISIVLVFFIFDIKQYLTLDNLKQNHEFLKEYVAENRVQSMIIYLFSYIIFTAINLPGAVFFTLAGGALFGLAMGTLLVSIAASIGSTFAFLITRYLIRDRLEKMVGNKMEEINRGIEREGAYYLFTIRLIPLFPFFLINIAMAMTSIKAWTFLWVSYFGMLAGTAVYVNAGTQLASLESVSDILSLRIILSFTLLGIFPLLAKRLLDYLSRLKIAHQKD